MTLCVLEHLRLLLRQPGVDIRGLAVGGEGFGGSLLLQEDAEVVIARRQVGLEGRDGGVLVGEPLGDPEVFLVKPVCGSGFAASARRWPGR